MLQGIDWCEGGGKEEALWGQLGGVAAAGAPAQATLRGATGKIGWPWWKKGDWRGWRIRWDVTPAAHQQRVDCSGWLQRVGCSGWEGLVVQRQPGGSWKVPGCTDGWTGIAAGLQSRPGQLNRQLGLTPEHTPHTDAAGTAAAGAVHRSARPACQPVPPPAAGRPALPAMLHTGMP